MAPLSINIFFFLQHMIADTVRLIRQCQKDHMGQYSDHVFLIFIVLDTGITFFRSACLSVI